MPRRICAFDLLPIELVHVIFNYFLAQEILHSFTNVSDYVDSILFSYSSHRLNFSSISKSTFDLVCRYIRPSQVISLTLSNANDTSGQSDLFLTHFRIEQFIQLRSLRLIEIELDSLESIFSNLTHLTLLRSLTYETNGIKTKCPNWIYGYSGMIINVKSCFEETAMRVLPRLNVSNLEIDVAKKLPRLRHLTLGKSNYGEINRILSQVPQLRSLNVSLQGDASHIHHLSFCSQLNRLTLKIDDSLISMTQMERLLPNLTQLINFELHAKGRRDLADGHRWKVLTEGLVTFNFKFQIYSSPDDLTLSSFRNEFWVREKRWYVAYKEEYLFSIPYFAPVEVHCSSVSLLSVWKTANDTSFYENVTKLNLSPCPSEDNIRIISTMMDFGCIQQLTISKLNHILFLNFYLLSMHCLHTLCINGSLSLDYIEQIRHFRFEQIRTLKISSNSKITDYFIEELLRIFPCVKHLYVSCLQSRAQMIRLIDGFQHLSSASFTITSWHQENERHCYFEPELLIRDSRRLTRGTYRCRFYRSMRGSQSYDIHIWIEEKVSSSSFFVLVLNAFHLKLNFSSDNCVG
ncbi:unnamed protein product [Rotaria socialis]